MYVHTIRTYMVDMLYNNAMPATVELTEGSDTCWNFVTSTNNWSQNQKSEKPAEIHKSLLTSNLFHKTCELLHTSSECK